MPTIEYMHDAVLHEDDPDLSLLEIALKNGIPHMHVCGGNARCSTCRVIVKEGAGNLLPRNRAEQKLADEKGLEENIRLACQTRIRGPVTLRRLVLDDQDIDLAQRDQVETSGREQSLAVLFSDIRDFTGFSEKHLPYDIVHILNRYFQAMGDAVLQNQGYIDKYIGDGLMALFGLHEDRPATACLQAVSAGLQMSDALQTVNHYLQRNFGEHLEIGIGIHFGEVVVGDIGHRQRAQLTAIGDTVNVASRIEGLTKRAATPLLISDSCFALIENRLVTGNSLKAELKGKSGVCSVYEVLGLTA